MEKKRHFSEAASLLVCPGLACASSVRQHRPVESRCTDRGILGDQVSACLGLDDTGFCGLVAWLKGKLLSTPVQDSVGYSSKQGQSSSLSLKTEARCSDVLMDT